MSGITIDFSQVPDRTPLAEGIYNLVIEEVEGKESSNGNPMLVMRLKEPETNTAIFENFVLLPQNMFRLKNLQQATGADFEGSWDTPEEAAASVKEALLGVEVQCKVGQREYNGETFNNIKKFIMG